MKDFKVDLMDWKALERSSEEQYKAGLLNSMLARFMYDLAIVEIHKLGGKTNEEEDELAKQEMKKTT